MKIRFKALTQGIVQKTFTYFLLMFTLPLVLSVFIITTLVSSQTIANTKETLQKNFDQTAAFLAYKANGIKNIVDIISYDSTIQEVISKSESYYRQNVGNWIIHTADAKNIMFNTYSTKDITSIHLYMQEGPASIEESSEFQKLSTAAKSEWYNRLTNQGQFAWDWFPEDFIIGQYSEPHIAFIKRIPSLNVVNKDIGIIKADVPESVFQDILLKSAYTEHSVIQLYNSYGEIMIQNGSKSIDPVFSYADTADGIFRETEVSGDKYLIGKKNIDGTNWTLAVSVPVDDVLLSMIQMRNQILAMFIILFAITIPAIYFFSKRYTYRIRKLASSIKSFSQKQGMIELDDSGDDEIAMLTRDFVQMTQDVDNLLHEKYIQGQKIKNLELRVLQAQINPHFLYNTLDMIHWMAIQIKADNIVKAVDSMALFYKASLGRGEEVVLLEQELKHVESYISLQNMRFDNRILLKENIPDNLRSCRVLKLLLQPLVENSIIHGIQEKEDEQGTITITAHCENNIVTICVEDDGVGMTPDQVENFLEHQDLQKGYGIRNIKQRIQYYYGAQYGLTCESEPEKGTRMIITIPFAI